MCCLNKFCMLSPKYRRFPECHPLALMRKLTVIEAASSWGLGISFRGGTLLGLGSLAINVMERVSTRETCEGVQNRYHFSFVAFDMYQLANERNIPTITC